MLVPEDHAVTILIWVNSAATWGHEDIPPLIANVLSKEYLPSKFRVGEAAMALRAAATLLYPASVAQPAKE